MAPVIPRQMHGRSAFLKRTMELDHLFICTPPGARDAAEALKAFGLTEGAASRHAGQGTANRRFFFPNAMLELLWVEDEREAQSEITAPTRLWERCSGRERGVSPWGVCFRPSDAGEKGPPFPTWSYRPAYLPDALSIEIAAGAPLSEPLWFYLPFGRRPDAYPREERQPLAHRAGLREITAARISLPAPDALSAPALSVPAVAAVQSGCITLGADASHLLELQFDHGETGGQHAFRPTLPLVFTW